MEPFWDTASPEAVSRTDGHVVDNVQIAAGVRQGQSALAGEVHNDLHIGGGDELPPERLPPPVPALRWKARLLRLPRHASTVWPPAVTKVVPGRVAVCWPERLTGVWLTFAPMEELTTTCCTVSVVMDGLGAAIAVVPIARVITAERTIAILFFMSIFSPFWNNE